MEVIIELIIEIGLMSTSLWGCLFWVAVLIIVLVVGYYFYC